MQWSDDVVRNTASKTISVSLNRSTDRQHTYNSDYLRAFDKLVGNVLVISCFEKRFSFQATVLHTEQFLVSIHSEKSE